jgi:hypothetical protein
MTNQIKIKLSFMLFICIFLCSAKGLAQERISIYFSEYYLSVNMIPKLGDTLRSNRSSKEYFKFIFYNTKGKCYCERYINNKLYEKGYYESSLDTLKRYIYGKNLGGKYSPIRVKKYFEPLKNGEWIVYKNGQKHKEVFVMGISKDKLIK